MRASQGKNSIPLTEDDKDFVKESKWKHDVPIVDKQCKRKKLGCSESSCKKVPEPDPLAKTCVPTETDVSAVTTPEDSNSLAQSESSTSNSKKTPESPV